MKKLGIPAAVIFILCAGVLPTGNDRRSAWPKSWTRMDDISPCLDVALEGNHAYCADGFKGLRIYDVSTSHPRLLATVDDTGFAWEIAVNHGLACLANDDLGLSLIDVTDPAQPAVRAVLPFPEPADAVSMDGDSIFVVAGDLYLIRLPVTGEPQVLGKYDARNHGLTVAAEGNLAFVGNQEGFGIIDFTIPAAPRSLTSQYSDTPIDFIHADGNRLYVSQQGITVYDISNPSAPRPIGGYFWRNDRFGMFSHPIMVQGTYAFLRRDWKLEVIDLADPAFPRRLPFVSDLNPNLAASDGAFGIILSYEDYQYQLDSEPRCLDLDQDGYSTGTGCGPIDCDDWQAAVHPGAPERQDGADNQCPGDTGFGTIDEGFWPRQLGFIQIPHMANMTAAEGKIYVSGPRESLQTIDAGDPLHLKITRWMDSCHAKVAVQGDTLFLSCGEIVLLLDQSNPKAPVVLSHIKPPGEYVIEGAVPGGDRLVLWDREDLHIYNIADQKNPSLQGSFSAKDLFILDVAVEGNLALLADANHGLRVFDLSDPAHPVQVGGYDFDSEMIRYTRAIAHGRKVFMLGPSRVDGFDLSNPREPRLLFSINEIRFPEGMAIWSQYLFVTDSVSGSAIYDLSDLEHPRRVSEIPLFNNLESTDKRSGITVVAADRDILYLLDDHNLLHALDLTRPPEGDRP